MEASKFGSRGKGGKIWHLQTAFINSEENSLPCSRFWILWIFLSAPMRTRTLSQNQLSSSGSYVYCVSTREQNRCTSDCNPRVSEMNRLQETNFHTTHAILPPSPRYQALHLCCKFQTPLGLCLTIPDLVSYAFFHPPTFRKPDLSPPSLQFYPLLSLILLSSFISILFFPTLLLWQLTDSWSKSFLPGNTCKECGVGHKLRTDDTNSR